MSIALEGISILDLTASQMPGRWASGLLGDFGAEVIVVERPPYKGRESGPSGVHTLKTRREIESFYAFNSFDRNKESITLNLKSIEARNIFYRLVKQADVVIEGYRPGVAKKLHVDYDTLNKINSGIIYCSITSYGQGGPYRNFPGYDLNIMALAGAVGITGEKGRAPVMPGVQIGDWVGGGFMSVVGILLALMARNRTGRGQFVDISMTDGVLACMAMFSEEYFRTGKVPKRGEKINTGGSHYNNIFRTKDKKYITIAAWDPTMYENLCRALGRDDLISYQHPSDDKKRDEIFAALSEIFVTKTRQEWFEFLAERNIAVAPEYSLDEVFTDPQILHRQMMIERDHPTVGKVKQSGIPIKLSDTPGSFKSFAPIPGRNTEEILLELGYSEEKIKELKKNGEI